MAFISHFPSFSWFNLEPDRHEKSSRCVTVRDDKSGGIFVINCFIEVICFGGNKKSHLYLHWSIISFISICAAQMKCWFCKLFKACLDAFLVENYKMIAC